MTPPPAPPQMAAALVQALATYEIPATMQHTRDRRAAVVLVGPDPDLNVWCDGDAQSAPGWYRWQAPHASRGHWARCHGGRPSHAASLIASHLRAPHEPLGHAQHER